MLHNVGHTFSLVFKSLWNRRGTAALTLASIAVSAALLSVVDRVRTDAQTSFSNTISGTDLIVGARSGDLNLLLYSVFRIGNPTNNISWSSFQTLESRREVDWLIPISLGDAHRGYRVLGTNLDYFEHYRYASGQTLEISTGEAFATATDAVIGAEVADRLGYVVGQQIVISHGITATSFVQHDDNPFTVAGILARTGTPVDRTVHISLAGMDLIHGDEGAGQGATGIDEHEPEAITAVLVGLNSKIGIFTLQRFLNEYEPEALSAVIPGVALQQLWGLIGVAEYALLGVSAMVVLAGVLGLLATLLVSLNERRREMSVLRSVGARPGHIFSLLLSEAAMLAFFGALLGLLAVQLGIVLVRQYALSEFGIQLSSGFRLFDVLVLAGILVIAVLVSVIPAWRAYRNSLADGLTTRI